MIFILILCVAIGILMTILSPFTEIPESVTHYIWIIYIFLPGGFGMAAVIARWFELQFKMSDQNLTKNELLENYQGKGTEDDPILIQSQKFQSDTVEIRNSSLSIVFSNCEFDRAFYVKCKNLTIQNCRFNECNLGKCSDIKIKDCVVNRLLGLYQCHDMLIRECTIQEFRLSYSHKNVIKLCNINQISHTVSGGNLFERNKIPGSELSKINNST